MDRMQMETLIQQLLDNSFFRMSIHQELQKIVEDNIQKPSLATSAIPVLLDQIMSHLTLVINFKIRQILDLEYTVLADQCVKINSQLESIKSRMSKVQTQGKIIVGKNGNISQSRKELQFGSDEQSTISNIQRQLSNKSQSQNSIKLTKLKQEVDSIKISLEKYSMKEILSFIAQTTQQINNKIDLQYQRLYHQIESTMKNTSILNCRSFDITENKYQAIEHKVQYLNEKFSTFEHMMQQRYETNFKNVWNVITDLGSNVAVLKNREKDKLVEKQNVSAKGIGSFFGWKM